MERTVKIETFINERLKLDRSTGIGWTRLNLELRVEGIGHNSKCWRGDIDKRFGSPQTSKASKTLPYWLIKAATEKQAKLQTI